MARPAPVILWLREDLRLADNPALAAAAAAGASLVPVYVRDEATPGTWTPGPAGRWWLDASLTAFAQALEARGSRLVLRSGRAEEVLPALAAEAGAAAVAWNRRPEPHWRAAEERLQAVLAGQGVRTEAHQAALLFDPDGPRTKAGEPYKVFTPYWKALQARPEPPEPWPAPGRLPPCPDVRSERLGDWRLAADAPDSLAQHWTPGEVGAAARLRAFLDDGLTAYDERRDRVDVDGTSRLSPHLHWGEVGPRQVWHAARRRGGREAGPFLRQLAWREFSHHLLHHWPDFPETSWQSTFQDFPWQDDAEALAAWRDGRTGYPIVDAAMRALAATGWLHNRLRMVVASFLTKHLLQPWQAGETWFWHTLADADLANNAVSWQWVAGSGADAAPYFRVFNPVLQGRRFDPDGAFTRRWLPELAALPNKHLHAPWEASAAVLEEAGVRLGADYPRPIVEHRAARRRALAAYQSLKKR